MKKLGTIIQYECTTSFKYIWAFYGIQFLIIGLISAIIAITTGSTDNVGTNCLEMNTFIYIGVLGVLGFKEDFRMLIQNGFTRKYIFIATVSMFAFISGIVAFVDTVVGNMLHYAVPTYRSIFGSLYGYDHMLMNWIWLFFVNLLICSVFYLAIIIINKLGKSSSVYVGVIIGAFVLATVAIFRFVVPSEYKSKLGELAVKAMGFMNDGAINFIYPILTILFILIILGMFSYHMIRRTELKE